MQPSPTALLVMSSVENIQANVETAVGKIPSGQLADAISLCETVEQTIRDIASPAGLLATLAIEVAGITEDLRSAADNFDVGSTALGQYVSDISAPAHMAAARHHARLQPIQRPHGTEAPVETTLPQFFEPDAHKQKVPETWDGLVALSGGLLADNSDPMAAARMLRKAFEPLTDQEIEDVRYYALGELCARLAPYLYNPERREEVIQKTVDSMLAWHPRYVYTNFCKAASGLYVKEIQPAFMKNGVAGVAAEAFTQLPLELQQLVNTISKYAAQRRVMRQFEDQGVSEPLVPTKILGHGEAVNSIAINMFSAVAGMTRDAILLSAPPAVTVGRHGEPAEYKLLLRDIIDPQDLRTLNIWQPAHAGARLHFDEVGYHDYIKKHLSKAADGSIYLNMRDLPENPPRVPLHTHFAKGTRALHDKRIGCPAKFVLPLIPSVLEILPEVIIRADQQIRAGHWYGTA